MEKITDGQREYIQEIQEMCMYSLPSFKGTSKQEANEYIKKYEITAFEKAWEATKGYD